MRFREAFTSGEFAGALRHVVDVMGVLGDDCVDPPNESETAGRLPVWREGENRRFRPLPGDAKRGRTGRVQATMAFRSSVSAKFRAATAIAIASAFVASGGARCALMILR